MRSETLVLIVGGGPSGLAASLTLSHLGVPSMLVNRYPGTLEHPKAVAIMQRTAELLRLWGAEDEVRRRGVPREFCERMVWTTTLSGEELGRTETVEPDDTAPEPQSPVTGLRCPQNITESVLRDRAQSHEIADLHYGFEMTTFEQDDDGVTATIVARDGGQTSTVRAQYLIGADGNDSTARNACGIGRAGDADMGHFVNILHRAPLAPLVRDRPGWGYAVITPELDGSFVTVNGDDLWLFHVNLGPGETVEDFTERRCVKTIRAAAGIDGLDVELISIKSWIMGAELSTAFRDRRVLLTGDAAHRTTPDGGVGMNTGLHSAHNLAWKVGAVVSGWADPDLLDTYETERRGVAEANVAYSAKRGGGMIKMIEACARVISTRSGPASRPGPRAGARAWTSGSATRTARSHPTGPHRRRSRTRWPSTCRTPAPGAARRTCGCSATASASRPSAPSGAGSCCSPGPTARHGVRPRNRPPHRGGCRSRCSASAKRVSYRRRPAALRRYTGSRATAPCWSGPTGS